MHMTCTTSTGALARPVAGATRQQIACSATPSRLPTRALSARAPGGTRLALGSFETGLSAAHRNRRVSMRAEESKEHESSETTDASSEDATEDSASEEEEAPVESEVEPEPAVAGYAALIADLRAALEEGRTEDLEAGLAAVEEEFVGMTEQVNEAKAMAKSQESIALAAKEQYLRSTADFENFRKRSGAEKDALRDSVRGDVVKDFLPLVDNFELAGKQIKLETDGEKKVDAAYQALYRQMVDIFKSLGVEPVDTVGTPFDPEFHEAIMQEPSDEVEDGAILEEFRRGFKIGEKLLRPAMVKVAINDGPTPTASVDESAESESSEAPAEADTKAEANKEA